MESGAESLGSRGVVRVWRVEFVAVAQGFSPAMHSGEVAQGISPAIARGLQSLPF